MNNNPNSIHYQFLYKAASDKLKQEHEIRNDFETLMKSVAQTGDYIYLNNVQRTIKDTLALIEKERK